MATNQTEEEKDGLSLPKLAGVLGVGYMAYRNRNNLTKQVKKVIGEAGVTLNKAAGNVQFKGKIDELKSLSNAVVDTYGVASPRNIARNIMSPESRKEMLDKNLSAYNKGMKTRLANLSPDDVVRGAETMGSQFTKNSYMAKREASLINMRKTANGSGERYKKALGGNLNDVINIFEENPQLLMKDPLRDAKFVKGASGRMDQIDKPNLDFVKAFREYNNNSKRSINLGIDPKDTAQQNKFISTMMGLANDTYMKTNDQVSEVSRAFATNGGLHKISKGNSYYQQKNLYDIATFEGLRNDMREKSQKGFAKVMTDNGHRPVTMQDAQNMTVENVNGKLFAAPTAAKGQTNGQTISELFSPNTRVKSASNRVGKSTLTDKNDFASQYIERGVRFGLDKETVGKDVFSNNLFIDPKTGEILDTTGLGKMMKGMGDAFQNNIQVPVIQMNPLDLAQRRSRLANANPPSSVVMPSGSIMAFMDQQKLDTRIGSDLKNAGAHAHGTNRAYVTMNDKLIDSGLAQELDGLSPADAYKAYQSKINDYVVEDGVRMVNQKTGQYARYGEAVSNRTNIELEDQGGSIKKLFGLGQENETLYGRVKRSVTKFKDPYYGENILDYIDTSATGVDGTLGAEEGMNRLYANLYGRTKDFSPNTREAVYDTLGNLIQQENPGVTGIDLFDMVNDDGVYSVAEQISASFKNKNQVAEELGGTRSKIRHQLENQIQQTFDGRYSNNPTTFGDSERYLKSRSIYQSDLVDTLKDNQVNSVSASADLRKLIEQYGVAIADERGVNLTESVLNSSGAFGQDALEEIGGLRALGQAGYFNTKAEKAVSLEGIVENRMDWRNFYSENKRDREELGASIRRADPWYGTGAGAKQEDLLGSGTYTPIKKHQGPLESINKELSQAAYDLPEGQQDAIPEALAVANGLFDYVGGAKTFVAGRNGPITDASMFPWFMANRLDTPLQDLGLGLPNHLKGSAGSILMNQWARRIVLPYAAFQTAKYFDGLTGDAFSDTAADTYVNMHQDVSTLKELTGINDFGRGMDKMMPWLEQVEALPGAKALNFATFGLFSDFRSGEEVSDYYSSGEDPIRKGRYWGLGSNSPWMGNKIDRYEANWYRKMKSDYMFSDNVYGSEKEYWANNWMPTLGNPLAPLKHFVTDPYHYEDKLEESRPFAITGGFNELQAIPLIGPAVDAVVSGVLKPTKVNSRLEKAHEEYLSSYNERLSAAYINMNAGGVVNAGPNGGITLRSDAFNVNFQDEDGMLDEEALVADEMMYNAERDRMAVSLMNDTGIIPQLPGGTIQGGLAVSAEQVETLEQTYGKGNVAGLGTIGSGRSSATASYLLGQMNARLTDAKTTSRSDQVSNAGTIGDPNLLTDLGSAINLQDLSSMQGPARDLVYNAGEIAGMYGFLSKTAFGFEEGGRGATLQSSEQFGSYQKEFWDAELGGLGGDLSEIGRRYLPRDPNKNYYNPIRNTMPGWMPGNDYFTDFLHGDPYSKIANGEMRLPGDAYEKLYNVKKDEQGNYSAFDRYRILADVALYSDQYRAAKKEVALLNGNGLLSDSEIAEYKQIREQASSKTKKKVFYEERFENADINMERVTVTKVIDQNTFLTKEYGDNPFKLAGVNVKSTDTENNELISQFISVGQTLKVGIDADPKNRVRDDMMNTMRVVVYTPHAAKGSKFGLQGLGGGQNLNLYLSKQSEERGGTVTIKDDGSAVATQALFSGSDLTTGKLMENIVHDVLPNIPIVNLFADKFLQVRSPVESYRKELYSKSWRDWKNPVGDWIMPMIDSTKKRNPMMSTLNGIGIGLLFGRGKTRWNTAMMMGGLFGVSSGARTVLDAGQKMMPGDDKPWIPKRREKEREVDEYFDKLKYVKYHGLYERARADALKYEQTDLEAMFLGEETRGKGNKNLKSYLNYKKKWLNIKKKAGEGNEQTQADLDDINAQLGEIDGDRPTGKIGPYAALALRYKEEFESTLYGAAETQDYNKIYRSLPSKDKQYFTAFQKASPAERQQILKLVPDNQKRIYQQQFGLEPDEPEDLKAYFKKKNLPGQNWEGWNQDVSLDNIKVKVMKAEGIELTESNYWGDDEQMSESSGAEAIPIQKGLFSSRINTSDLEEALRGAGLSDVRISMQTGQADNDNFQTTINLKKDRKAEIQEGLKEYANQL